MVANANVSAESKVIGSINGLTGNVAKNILNFPGEQNGYKISQLTLTANGVASATLVEFMLNRDKGNNLTRSNEFSNAAWTKTNVTATDNATYGPFALASAATVIENLVNGAHTVSRGSLSVTNGEFYVLDVYARTLGRNVAIEFTGTEFDQGGSVFPKAVFDIRTRDSEGIATILSSVGTITTEIKRVGPFYRLRIIAQAKATGSAAGVTISLANDAGATSYVGDNTSGAALFGASFRLRDWANDYVATSLTTALTGAARIYPIQLQGTSTVGAAMSFPVELETTENGAPLRVIANATISNIVAAASGHIGTRPRLTRNI